MTSPILRLRRSRAGCSAVTNPGPENLAAGPGGSTRAGSPPNISFQPLQPHDKFFCCRRPARADGHLALTGQTRCGQVKFPKSPLVSWSLGLLVSWSLGPLVSWSGAQRRQAILPPLFQRALLRLERGHPLGERRPPGSPAQAPARRFDGGELALTLVWLSRHGRNVSEKTGGARKMRLIVRGLKVVTPLV
jgi:hypothetical protein